jgi:plastocyanin
MGAVGFTGHAGAKLAWEGKVPDESAMAMDHSGAPTGDAGAVSPAVPGPPLPGEGIPGVDVVMGEWDLVTSVDSSQPGTITFRFRNMGTLPHSLRIRSQGEGGERVEWESELVGPGESGLLVADLAAGSYDLDCPVEDAAGEHDALGMNSVFTVTPDAPALAPLPGSPATVAPDAGSAGGSAGAEAAASAATVNIQAFAFTPAVVRVKAGGTVTWTNNDSAVHTATGTGFDTGRLARGESATITFNTPGTFDYRCTPHPAMRAVVIVEP